MLYTKSFKPLVSFWSWAGHFHYMGPRDISVQLVVICIVEIALSLRQTIQSKYVFICLDYVLDFNLSISVSC